MNLPRDGANPFKKRAIGIAATLIGIALLEQSVLRQLAGDYGYFVIVTVIWSIVLWGIYGFLPRVHGVDKMSIRKSMYWWTLNTALIFIVVNSVISFQLGVAKSPYTHEASGMLLNGMFIVTQVVGRESIRAYLVNTFCRRKKGWQWWLIILLMVATQFNFNVLSKLQDFESFFRMMIKDVLPCVTQNILATYWVRYGGAGASAIGLGVLAGFEWFSPWVPQFNWFMQSMLIAAEYIMATLLTRKVYEKRSHDKHKAYLNVKIWLKESPFIIGAILLVWFVIGVFSVYPKVILTGSMEPFIQPGDIVLVERFQEKEEIEQLAVGDVILFKKEDKDISHRIINIIEKQGMTLYQTKGDANQSPDTTWVSAKDLLGKVIKVVPKVGVLSLWWKENSGMGEE